MRRGIVTVLLACLFYGGLLYGSVAWRKSAQRHDPVAVSGSVSVPQAELEAQALNTGTSIKHAAPQTTTAPVPKPPAPDIDREPARFAAEQLPDGGWEIDGRLADAKSAQAIKAALSHGGTNVLGDITVDAQTDRAPWATLLAAWLATFTGAAESAAIAVIDDQLILVGQLPSAAARDALLTQATLHFAHSGLRLIDELEIVDHTEEPQLAIAPSESGGLQIAGRLRDAELKNRLIALIQELRADLLVEEQIATGDHIGAAIWAPQLVQVLPALINEVKGLQMMASGGVFLMAGSVSADSTRTAIGEMASQAFAGMPISIDNQLTVAAEPDTPSLSISRGEDGVLQLVGLLPEQAQADRFIAAATRQKGPAPVNQIQVRDNVAPALWLDALAELVPPFAASTKWGALSVHGNMAAIEAEVTDPETADVLSALVANAFPEPDYKCVISIGVATPEGPSEQDIAALESALESSVVYFNIASARVGRNDRKKLGALADALAKAPGSSLALLGHADSKGNSAYNLRLSRQRCESVRAALEELGVDHLLMEIEEKGETADSRAYKSARRVTFELR